MTKSKNTKGLVGSNTYVDIDELTTLRADNKHLKRQLEEAREELEIALNCMPKLAKMNYEQDCKELGLKEKSK